MSRSPHRQSSLQKYSLQENKIEALESAISQLAFQLRSLARTKTKK